MGLEKITTPLKIESFLVEEKPFFIKRSFEINTKLD
jgi:hypothetical protein